MTAKTSSINGVTRLHSFEIDITKFERKGAIMCSGDEASTLGFKPGEFPDSFHLNGPLGTFLLFEVLRDGSHAYHSADGNCRFTIFND
jgi:hypothetical protein